MANIINLKEKVWKFAAENQNVPEIRFMLADPDKVVISEVNGRGLVNYIIRVQTTDGQHSVILKYGEEYVRHIPSIRLGLRRQAREYEALKLMDRILPGSVPKPYCHDTKNNFICMEDMGHMEVLGDDLLKGEINLESASIIGKILAQMHQATARKTLSETEWKQLEENFGGEESYKNREIRSSIFLEDHPIVFVPEMVKPVYRKLSRTLLTASIDKKLKEKYSQLDCFILSDNSWMSMFSDNRKIVLYDFESSFLGNPMEQLAWAANNYFICSKEAVRNIPERSADIAKLSEEAFRKTVESYFESRDGTMPCKQKTQKEISTLAFFIGHVNFYMAVITHGEKLISLTDTDKIDLITVGSQLLMTSEHISSLDDIINILFCSEQ